MEEVAHNAFRALPQSPGHGVMISLCWGEAYYCCINKLVVGEKDMLALKSIKGKSGNMMGSPSLNNWLSTEGSYSFIASQAAG